MKRGGRRVDCHHKFVRDATTDDRPEKKRCRAAGATDFPVEHEFADFAKSSSL